MNVIDRISGFASQLGSSLKSLCKLALQSRACTVGQHATSGEELVIMGNGPSLSVNIDKDLQSLQRVRTMAVNFAANAGEFTLLRPDFYLIADPHFFEGRDMDPNVERMFRRFNEDVCWEMVLFIPVSRCGDTLGITNPLIRIEKFNTVGVEGFRWLEDAAYGSGRGMPRPRNVLIPAIMVGLRMGFKKIFLLGADHSWMRTLDVDDDNRVVSVQPHFYKDTSEEKARVTSVYRDVRLHDILLSFHLAFKSYHSIERYARSHGCEILNSTPGSFIDAFERQPFISI